MSSEIDYLDFELTVEKAEGDKYLVRARSGENSAEIQFTSPFSEDKKALIKATTKANLRSSRKVRSASGTSEVKQLKGWGTQLFEQAIAGDVGTFYEKCRVQAEQQGKGIRWRLALDASVDDLPWEFLCSQGEFVALNPYSPVIRYMPRRARLAPLKESEHPLRLLVVIASPSDEIPLDTAAEKDRIIRAFESLTSQGLVEVSFIEGPDTWQQLYDTLFKNETHILHFIGHGAYDEDKQEGVLVMEDAEGKAKRIESEGLRVLVQGRSRLRLVVLNSCLGTEGDDSQPFSSVAAGLIQSGVPAVIAMQVEISDDAAKEIADTFYKSLALNMPVDTAITEARRKIYLFDLGSLEWATPILYMQVPNGKLFQFKQRVTGALPAPPEPEPETVQAIAVLIESSSGREIPLSIKSIKIGRGPDNDLKVEQEIVSRKHASLVRSKDTYAVENFGRSGTFLNGKPVTRRTPLKHNDVIRMGTAEFKFRLLAAVAAEIIRTGDTKVVTERAPRVTASEPSEVKESFAAKAARLYQSGDTAMERGDWAKAASDFRGALLCVPNYQDAGQKASVCERRDKAVTAYQEAQRCCAGKRYDQALQMLAQALRLDPDLVDQAGIRETAECGQKYQRALAELQRGNRDGGATLLREVIDCRPHFEDAEKRFDNLTSGGTGLFEPTPAEPTAGLFDRGKELGKEFWADMFGSKPAPAQGALVPPTPTSQQQPATVGYPWRVYELANPDLKQLAEEIRRHFQTLEFESQIIEQGGKWIVQGRNTGWIRLVGMGQAATVVLEPTGDGLKISIGGGKWAEQGAVMAAGILLGPLLITSALGMSQQKQLLDNLWQVVESFVKINGGHPVAFG